MVRNDRVVRRPGLELVAHARRVLVDGEVASSVDLDALARERAGQLEGRGRGREDEESRSHCVNSCSSLFWTSRRARALLWLGALGALFTQVAGLVRLTRAHKARNRVVAAR